MSHEQSEFKDYSPELLLHLGDVAYIATWRNTTVHLYLNPVWSNIAHFTVDHQDIPHGGRVFDNRRALGELMRLDYPTLFRRRPTAEEFEAYADWQASRLDSELEP